MVALRSSLGHCQGGNPTNINHCVQIFVRPEGHREPRNEFGSLRLAERLVGFEPGSYRF